MVIESLIDLFNVSKKAKDFYFRKDQLHLDQSKLKQMFTDLEADVNYVLMTFRANDHIKLRVINANNIKQLVWVFHPPRQVNEFMIISAISEQPASKKHLITETIRFRQSNDFFESAFKQKELMRISLNLQAKALSYLVKLSDYQFKNRFLTL